ncbi:hypothetical protein AB0C10_16080 [Microbispora amethystogenes]|uniref:hypothetical protein n=1 Tax=Microbispora amethystogenes TaxID=1427754 RepID=UPI0033E161A2
MSHGSRALSAALTVTATAWVAAAVATAGVILTPHLGHGWGTALTLLWLHSGAIVATIVAAAILIMRHHDKVYQLGLDHGVDLANTLHHAGV